MKNTLLRVYLSESETYLYLGKDYIDIWDTAENATGVVFNTGDIVDDKLLVGILQRPASQGDYLLLRDVYARHFIYEIPEITNRSKHTLDTKIIKFGNNDLLISYCGDGMFFQRLRVPTYPHILEKDRSRAQYGTCPDRLRVEFGLQDLINFKLALQSMISAIHYSNIYYQDGYTLDFTKADLYTKQMMIYLVDSIIHTRIREFTF